MSDLNDLLRVLGDLSPVLVRAVEEATDLRTQMTSPPLESDVDAIEEALVHNRKILDRLEHLTARLVLVRSRAAKVLAQAKGELDDALARATTAPTVGFGDYASAEEKRGTYHAAALSEVLAHRKADAFYKDVDSSWDYCRMLLRGAEGAHRDLELRLRVLSLSMQLAR